MMYPEPRNPSGPELAGLLAALLQQRHPAVPRFSTAEDALAFLLDQCTIAVFERFGDSDEGDSGTAFFMLMDQGPQFVSLAIFDPGSGRWQLFHATLDDFAPYEAPSKRPPRQPPAVIARSAQPRAADAADLADFLRMFRAVHDPFLMEQFKTDAARLEYLASEVRIAIFDYGQSGAYEGPLACFLWPAQTRFVMVASRPIIVGDSPVRSLARGRWIAVLHQLHRIRENRIRIRSKRGSNEGRTRVLTCELNNYKY